MSRKKNSTIYVGTITSDQLRKMSRPRQLPTTGFGIHGDTKYNRRKKKAEDRRIIDGSDDW